MWSDRVPEPPPEPPRAERQKALQPPAWRSRAAGRRRKCARRNVEMLSTPPRPLTNVDSGAAARSMGSRIRHFGALFTAIWVVTSRPWRQLQPTAAAAFQVGPLAGAGAARSRTDSRTGPCAPERADVAQEARACDSGSSRRRQRPGGDTVSQGAAAWDLRQGDQLEREKWEGSISGSSSSWGSRQGGTARAVMGAWARPAVGSAAAGVAGSTSRTASVARRRRACTSNSTQQCSECRRQQQRQQQQ